MQGLVDRARLAGLAMIAMVALAGVARADTHLAGTLTDSTTWTLAGSPYILDGDVTVPAAVSLTIDAGVEVRAVAFSDSLAAGLDTHLVELTVQGQLHANGTADHPVVFDSSSGMPGSWYGLVLQGGPIHLSYTHIQSANVGMTTFGGTAADHVTVGQSLTYGVWVRAGIAPLDTLTVSGSLAVGVRISDSGSATLTGCVIYQNTIGIEISPTDRDRTLIVSGCSLNANNIVSDAAEPFSNSPTVTIVNSIISSPFPTERMDNAVWHVSFTDRYPLITPGDTHVPTLGQGVIALNPLFVSDSDLRLTSNSPARLARQDGTDLGALPYDGVPTPGPYGVLRSDTTLTAAGSPYAVIGDMTVLPGVTLTIEPGVTLNFSATDQIGPSQTDMIVQGSLIAEGTAMQPIVMTSPDGHWGGVTLDKMSSGSRLDHVTVRAAMIGVSYNAAGGDDTLSNLSNLVIDAPVEYGLFINNSTARLIIDGVRVDNAGVNGFLVNSARFVSLTNCVAFACGFNGIVDGASHGDVTNCTIVNSGSTGILWSGNSPQINIVNSIVAGSPVLIDAGVSGIFQVSHSDLFGGQVLHTFPTDSITLDPRFVDPADPSNLHLAGNSPAIDTGVAGPVVDIAGTPRPLDGDGLNGEEWDMGAYEYVRHCGDGVVELGEACDDGARNGEYGLCNTRCTGPGPRCGDGLMNGPEQCDDGNQDNTDACLNTCVTARCGDGVVQAGVEQCDDGNQSNTDACLNTCVTARCGDGVVQAGVEQCDDGNGSNTDACLNTCVTARCGDGFVEAGVEQCDDGNRSNTDACLNTCVSARCGDGFVEAGVEQCDDGNRDDTDACRNSCALASCGDGVVEAGEQCDDGNHDDTDACRNNCMLARCGDGVVQAGVEQCDDGNQDDTDACRNSCVPARCGDGVVEAGVEACDDGNQDNTDACTDQCVSATCGDGVVQAGVEQCDDGNRDDTDGCRNNCMVARCGDGVVQAGSEQCDDGNTVSGDGCSAACEIEVAAGSGGSGGSDGSSGAGSGSSSGQHGGCQASGDASGSLPFVAMMLGALVRRRRRR